MLGCAIFRLKLVALLSVVAAIFGASQCSADHLDELESNFNCYKNNQEVAAMGRDRNLHTKQPNFLITPLDGQYPHCRLKEEALIVWKNKLREDKADALSIAQAASTAITSELTLDQLKENRDTLLKMLSFLSNEKKRKLGRGLPFIDATLETRFDAVRANIISHLDDITRRALRTHDDLIHSKTQKTSEPPPILIALLFIPLGLLLFLFMLLTVASASSSRDS